MALANLAFWTACARPTTGSANPAPSTSRALLRDARLLRRRVFRLQTAQGEPKQNYRVTHREVNMGFEQKAHFTVDRSKCIKCGHRYTRDRR